MKDTGQYFTSDSAEDGFCRLFGQVRQLYYLDLDRRWHTHISKCCNGKLKSAYGYGYVWKYPDTE